MKDSIEKVVKYCEKYSKKTFFKGHCYRKDDPKNLKDFKKKWEERSEEFKEFWKEKIVNPEYTSLDKEKDIKPISILLNNVSVRYQFSWYKIFNNIKSNPDLQTCFEAIFKATTDDKRIATINELKKVVDKLKEKKDEKFEDNATTAICAEAGIPLNQILFLNDPNNPDFPYFSYTSINHRKQIIGHYKLDPIPKKASYGEEIILSQRHILEPFKEIRKQAHPWEIAAFFL